MRRLPAGVLATPVSRSYRLRFSPGAECVLCGLSRAHARAMTSAPSNSRQMTIQDARSTFVRLLFTSFRRRPRCFQPRCGGSGRRGAVKKARHATVGNILSLRSGRVYNCGHVRLESRVSERTTFEPSCLVPPRFHPTPLLCRPRIRRAVNRGQARPSISSAAVSRCPGIDVSAASSNLPKPAMFPCSGPAAPAPVIAASAGSSTANSHILQTPSTRRERE